MRHAAPHPRRRRHVFPTKAEAHPLALDRAPRDDRAGTVGIVKSAHRADPGPAQALGNPRSGTGQILELEARVHAGQVGAAPHDRGRRLVRLGSRFRQPRARCHRDRDRYALGERRGDRRFHAGDQDPRIIAGTEARRELVDRVDRGHREHALDRGNHPTVDVNVALDPLGTHDEPRAERSSIADPIARSNACTLRDCVDGDQGRIRVGRSPHSVGSPPPGRAPSKPG